MNPLFFSSGQKAGANLPESKKELPRNNSYPAAAPSKLLYRPMQAV